MSGPASRGRYLPRGRGRFIGKADECFLSTQDGGCSCPGDVAKAFGKASTRYFLLKMSWRPIMDHIPDSMNVTHPTVSRRRGRFRDDGRDAGGSRPVLRRGHREERQEVQTLLRHELRHGHEEVCRWNCRVQVRDCPSNISEGNANTYKNIGQTSETKSIKSCIMGRNGEWLFSHSA